MKQNWEKFVRRVDGISLRERALIFLAIAAVLIGAIKPLLFDPLLKQRNEKEAMVAQGEGKLREVQEHLTAAMQTRTNDKNSPQRKRLEKAKQQIAEDRDYIKSISNKLVPPNEMADLLKQVLDKNGKLELVELTTQPSTPLLGAKTEVDATTTGADEPIYKHGFTITIRGSYPDLLQYLDALKGLQEQMFWTDAKMDASKYPAVELTVTVYTLSLDKTWLTL
jgi:MSHA biogenesis protein MshJ